MPLPCFCPGTQRCICGLGSAQRDRGMSSCWGTGPAVLRDPLARQVPWMPRERRPAKDGLEEGACVLLDACRVPSSAPGWGQAQDLSPRPTSHLAWGLMSSGAAEPKPPALLGWELCATVPSKNPLWKASLDLVQCPPPRKTSPSLCTLQFVGGRAGDQLRCHCCRFHCVASSRSSFSLG